MTGRRLLAVMAHPDDESFGPGGSLAAAAADGVEVHLVTMTDGAAGTTKADLEPRVLAELRGEELRNAAAALGIELLQLDHRDSGFNDPVAGSHPEALVNVPHDDLVAELSEIIQRLRPHVVLTHDETGGYGHPDHVRCYEITVAAVRAATPWIPSRVYCEVTSDRWMKVVVGVLRMVGRDPTAVGANRDVDLTQVGVPSAMITTRIDIRGHWQAKKAAARCHRSQGGGPPHTRWLPVWVLDLLFPSETFVRVLPSPEGGLRETSFFAGL